MSLHSAYEHVKLGDALEIRNGINIQDCHICFPQPTYRLAIVGLLVDWWCEYHDCSFWSSDVRRRSRTIIRLCPTNVSEGMLLKGGGRWKRRGKKEGKGGEMKGKDEGRGGGGRKREWREKRGVEGERGKQQGSQKTKEKMKDPSTTNQLTSCEFWDVEERARGFCAPFCVWATVVLRRS